MRWVWLACVALLGCAKTGQLPSPGAPGGTAAAPRSDDVAVEPVPAMRRSGLPPPAAGVPPPPPRCSAFTVTAEKPPACPPTPEAWRVALDSALSAAAEPDRGMALGALEGCPGVEPGFVRALRAEVAPDGCADAVVEPFLRGAGENLRPDLRDTLVGLGLGARLTRLVRTPPRLEPPYDRDRFMQFFEERLTGWIVEQARAIQFTSSQGADLGGYGQGIVAIEAGLADMRFVEIARDVPLPDDMRGDAEIEDVYYATLDQALEPRKVRGRDAALVGLKRFSEVGAIRDRRVERARNLLSKLFGGRRIDALDGLMLPEAGALAQDSVEVRLAARLPTFYAAFVLDGAVLDDPLVLRALSERGLFAAARRRARDAALSAEATRAIGRGLFELGRVYFRAPDFSAAADVLGRIDDARAGSDVRLLGALCRVLENGPRDAAELMLRGPRYPEGIGGVEPLDAIAQSGGATAGMAGFDAAYLLRLVPPLEPDPGFWESLAQRFDRAAGLLGGQAKQRAVEGAKAARETAAAIREAQKSPPGEPES